MRRRVISALSFSLLFLIQARIQAAEPDPEAQRNSWQISEASFTKDFEELILPFWKEGTSQILEGQKGVQIYTWRRIHPKAKAQIIISHGYSEQSLKYRETAYNFYQQGYSVFIVDHRGHGRSGRIGAQRYIVDVEQFADYVADFKSFYDQMPWDRSRPLYLFGHSMGALISVAFMEKYPQSIQAAALCAPMFEPSLRGLPVSVGLGIAKLLAWLFGPDQYTIFQQRASLDNWHFKDAGTSSQPRFERYRSDSLKEDLATGGPTNRWVIETFEAITPVTSPQQAQLLKMPIYIGIAGNDRLVKPQKMLSFCESLWQCESHLYPGSYHEIWNERDAIRHQFLEDVFNFFDTRRNAQH